MRHRVFRYLDSDDSEDEFLCEGPPKPKKKTNNETYLFDCSVRVTINSPQSDENHINLRESALAVIAAHTLFNNQQWIPLGYPLFHVLTEKVAPDPFTWRRDEDRKIYDGFGTTTGRFVKLNLELNNPKALYDTVSYNGCVQDTQIYLEYEATTFLSCIIQHSNNAVLDGHGFCSVEVPKASDEQRKILFGILEEHKKRKKDDFDHELAWATVHDYLTAETERRVEEMIRDFGGLD